MEHNTGHEGFEQKTSTQSAKADFEKVSSSAKEAVAGFKLNKLFEGRIGNMQFLYFVVGAFAVGLLTSFIPLVNILVGLALMVVGVGVGIRRWHDVGVTGWATLAFFVPIVGLLVVIYLCWKKGDEEGNVYGQVPDPSRPIFHAILNS